MYQLVATYAPPDDPEAFLAHYRTTHMPLARAFPGVRSLTWMICETLDGSPPPHFVVITARWDSKEDALASVASPEGQAAVADLANFAGAGVDIEFGECTIEV